MSIEEILARCIDNLERGSTIEACCAQYPEHAIELRALLSLKVQLSSGLNFRLSDRAFSEGRRRMQQQIRQNTAARYQSQDKRTARHTTSARASGAFNPNSAIDGNAAVYHKVTTQQAPRRPFLFGVKVVGSVAAALIFGFLLVKLSGLDLWLAANPTAISTSSTTQTGGTSDRARVVPTFTETALPTWTAQSISSQSASSKSGAAQQPVPAHTHTPTPVTFIEAGATGFIVLPTKSPISVAIALSPVPTVESLVFPSATPQPSATWTSLPPAETPLPLPATATALPTATNTVLPSELPPAPNGVNNAPETQQPLGPDAPPDFRVVSTATMTVTLTIEATATFTITVTPTTTLTATLTPTITSALTPSH